MTRLARIALVALATAGVLTAGLTAAAGAAAVGTVLAAPSPFAGHRVARPAPPVPATDRRGGAATPPPVEPRAAQPRAASPASNRRQGAVTGPSTLPVGPAGASPSTLPVAPARPPATGGPHRAYVPPVDAAVVDGFRPPACPWCAANRGLEYATTAGTPVRASGAGVVTFAGPVGADLFVVVAHPDGLRSTYAFVASLAVVAGARVAQGDVVGTAGTRLVLTFRRAAVYLDPGPLLAGAAAVPRLVPLGPTGGP